ncbi:MAG: glycosyltransferase family 39 protein [Patescibacteria group bacterium]
MNQFTASLWGDEAFAAVLASKSIPEIIRIVSRDTSPPFYYLLLHSWMKIFGNSEIAIRSLSFLFFLGTVIVVYFLGKSLWNKRTGLAAATLTFLNPFLFQYGFEGRMYSLLLLTTTTSMYFYLKKNRLFYILTTVAALYTHHFSLFVVFVQFLWTLKEAKRETIFSSLKPYFIIGLLYLPWLFPLYYQTSLVSSGFWLGKPTLKTIAELFGSFFLGTSKHYLQPAVLLAVVVLFLLRRLKNWRKDGFLLAWALVPIILTFLISQAKSSIFYDRYLLYSLPPILLLLASQRRIFSLTFIFLTIFSLTIIDWHYFTHPVKRPFKELATYVKQNKKPEYGLINFNAQAHHLFESKYYGLSAPLYVPQGSLPFYTGTALMEKDDILKTLPKKEKIMVISSGEPEKTNLPGYFLEEKVKFDSLYLLWFKKEKFGCPSG